MNEMENALNNAEVGTAKVPRSKKTTELYKKVQEISERLYSEDLISEESLKELSLVRGVTQIANELGWDCTDADEIVNHISATHEIVKVSTEDTIDDIMVPDDAQEESSIFSTPSEEKAAGISGVVVVTPEEHEKRMKKLRNREAHLRRYNRLSELGFSDGGIKWILNWAFKPDNKLFGNKYMPEYIHIMLKRLMSRMKLLVEDHKSGTLPKLLIWDLNEMESKFLNDWLQWNEIPCTIKQNVKVRKGSLGDMFADEFNKLN